MKINEKNLTIYSISRDHIDKEGYLLKRGEVNKTFQRRWFVLKGNLLFYFEKKGDKEPIGVIILEGCRTELAESEKYYVFKLIFSGPNLRVYELSAESQEELESWMKYISRSSYDYLKLMVAELQKQLKEIEDSENSSYGRTIVPPTSLCSFPTSVFHKPRENPFNKSEELSYNDLWKCNESLLDAAALLTKSSRSSCGLGYAKVNPSLPPSIPFRAAPPPPIVKAPSLKSPFAKISFTLLHDQYGAKIVEDRSMYTPVKLRHCSQTCSNYSCSCEQENVFIVDVNDENLIEL